MRYQHRKKKKQQALTSKQVGIKYGFRSGLEEVIAEELTKNSVDYTYEETKLSYIKPQKTHTYTPDFYLPKQKIFIETKGMFTTADRQKMRLIKEQYPELDIRFVFSNARSRISKKSQTTYGMWCEKYGFLYAHKTIPNEWLD
jgi:hypothetical protein